MAYLMPSDPLQFRSMYQREDSEDSDGEGGLGNVSRVLIRPPGHTGKAKKGHLCFDASFESGNLGRVDLISEFEYDLFIRPDTCSPRYRIWFNFTVDNFKQDQRVIFNIVNFSKNKLLFRDILTPIVKSTTRPNWQRIPRKNVWYHKSNVHKHNYILTFAFAFDREEEVYQFSMSLPYSYSKLQLYLNLVFDKYNYKLNNHLITHAYLYKEVISLSIQQRNIDLITIGNNNNNNLINNQKQRVVVILARIHPGEPPSSYVCQGIIDFLTSTNKIAEYLREHIIFKIVPMLNPDGVYLGNYKSTLMGFDLNHSYHIASPWAHPTIWSIIQMLKGLDDSNFYQLDFIFDLHSHTSLMGCFIYGNTYDDIYRYERHIVFPKLLSYNTDDYNFNNTMYNSDVNKIGTARRYLCSILSDYVNCYTLHVSMGGYYIKQQVNNNNNISTNNNNYISIPYTKDSYMRLGRNFIKTFIDYYKMIGVIITNDLLYELPMNSNNTERLSRSSRHKRNNNKSKSPLFNNSTHKIRSRSLSQRTNIQIHYTDIYKDDDNIGITFVLKQQQHKQTSYDCCSNKKLCDQHDIKKLRHNNKLPTSSRIKSQTIKSKTIRQLSSPTILNYPPLPSLSIIDFNQLTRGGIDKAIGNIKDKLPTESKTKISKKR